MSDEHRKDVRLAAAAFHAALAGDWAKTARYVARISDECGGEGLEVALRAWCDTYLDYATDGQDVSVGAIGFVRAGTGQLDGADSERVPVSVRWAGRLIEARGRMDMAGWGAALNELPDDGLEIGTHVLAVLRCVATTVNGLPRGFATMGGEL